MGFETSPLEGGRTAWDGLDHGPSPFLARDDVAAANPWRSMGPGRGWEPNELWVAAPAAFGAKPAGGVGAATTPRKSPRASPSMLDGACARAAARGGLPCHSTWAMAAGHAVRIRRVGRGIRNRKSSRSPAPVRPDDPVARGALNSVPFARARPMARKLRFAAPHLTTTSFTPAPNAVSFVRAAPRGSQLRLWRS